jgi:hypothetical protein
VAEKTDKPKQASGRGQARKNAAPAAKRTAKKSARRADKTAAAASKPKKSVARKSETKKPAAKNGRKRAAKAVAEELAMTKEELAARRIAGGQDAETAGSDAAQTQAPNGTRALTAANDDSAPATLGSMPSEPAPAEDQLEAVARNADSVKPNKTDPRSRAGENAECGPRPNTLVPTNGIHATERRIKRKLYQNRGVMGLIAPRTRRISSRRSQPARRPTPTLAAGRRVRLRGSSSRIPSTTRWRQPGRRPVSFPSGRTRT